MNIITNKNINQLQKLYNEFQTELAEVWLDMLIIYLSIKLKNDIDHSEVISNDGTD